MSGFLSGNFFPSSTWQPWLKEKETTEERKNDFFEALLTGALKVGTLANSTIFSSFFVYVGKVGKLNGAVKERKVERPIKDFSPPVKRGKQEQVQFLGLRQCEIS